jgi:hypothetical protein
MRPSPFPPLLALVAAFFTAGTAGSSVSPTPTSAPAEDFFIVSSVDLARGSIVLKKPTEVTLAMRVTEKTGCVDEKGRTIPLSELRAGDTVFIASAPDSSGQLVANRIRLGPMTVKELRLRYLRGGSGT